MNPPCTDRGHLAVLRCEQPTDQTSHVAVGALHLEIGQVFVAAEPPHVGVIAARKRLLVFGQDLAQIPERHRCAVAHARAVAVLVVHEVFKAVAEEPADVDDIFNH